MLDKLLKTRKQSTILAGIGITLFFVFFWISCDLAKRCPGMSQTIVLLAPFAFLLTPLMLTIKAYSIHTQIRTLLVFKSLSK